MAQGKKSFILYCDLMEIVHELTDEEAGKLLKIIVDYVNDKNPEINDRSINLAFIPIKNALKKDLKKWEKTREIRSEAGRKGGLAKSSKKDQKLAKASKSQNSLANLPVNDNDNVNDNVNVDSHNEIFKRIWNSEAWIESRCIAWKCSVEDLKDHLHNFRRDCIDKGDLKDDESKAKSHFINWVNKGNPIAEKAQKVTKSNIKDNWW